ncbi:uncharacterized protein N7515_005998 [Penicillium bovifimosum]|uniref:Uncharacterized protein n=1 Tax=Penicillium bovifimosum TaxID=126998 RepID=A0A9W9GTT6_9EURO|nr:uncharacterized protein N7515_005998 [Penicillium bovifimosum]KAJ5129959.1 hypothetical protein N7515_005998 [Penicillium bovifimosum]
MEPTNQVFEEDRKTIDEDSDEDFVDVLDDDILVYTGERWHTQMALVPSLPSVPLQPVGLGKKKRKRDSDGTPSPRPAKKRRPAFANLHELLVTYRGLQEWERKISEDLAYCQKLIAKHHSGSIFQPKYRPGSEPPPFQYFPSPLCEETAVDALEDACVEDACVEDARVEEVSDEGDQNQPEGHSSFWGHVQQFFWMMW